MSWQRISFLYLLVLWLYKFSVLCPWTSLQIPQCAHASWFSIIHAGLAHDKMLQSWPHLPRYCLSFLQPLWRTVRLKGSLSPGVPLQWYPGNHKCTQTYIGLRLPGYHWGSTLGDNDPFCIANVHIGLGLPGYHWGLPKVTMTPSATVYSHASFRSVVFGLITQLHRLWIIKLHSTGRYGEVRGNVNGDQQLDWDAMRTYIWEVVRIKCIIPCLNIAMKWTHCRFVMECVLVFHLKGDCVFNADTGKAFRVSINKDAIPQLLVRAVSHSVKLALIHLLTVHLRDSMLIQKVKEPKITEAYFQTCIQVLKPWVQVSSHECRVRVMSSLKVEF